MKHLLIFTLLITLLAYACNPHSNNNIKYLTQTVHDYHKNLIFQRIEQAATNIDPKHRQAFLELHNNPDTKIKITEADINNIEKCPQKSDCYNIHTTYQWFEARTQQLNTQNVAETWIFDKNTDTWLLSQPDK